MSGAWGVQKPSNTGGLSFVIKNPHGFECRLVGFWCLFLNGFLGVCLFQFTFCICAWFLRSKSHGFWYLKKTVVFLNLADFLPKGLRQKALTRIGKSKNKPKKSWFRPPLFVMSFGAFEDYRCFWPIFANFLVMISPFE